MKKILRVSLLLFLGCTTLLSATACGKKSSSQDPEQRQERTIAPQDVTDDSINPETPHCPDCPRKPKISRLPYMKQPKREANHKKVRNLTAAINI